MPSVNSFETDMRKLRRKRRTKRHIKNFSLILGIVVIGFLVYLSRDAWLNYFDGILARASTNVTTIQNDGALAGGNYPIDISKKTHTRIGKMQKNWTLFADTTFYVYDRSGDIVYSAQASCSNPVVEESEKRTLVYDQGGYNFMVAGPKKEIYSKRLSGQILLGSIGADGSVAIVTANDKYASYLTVYDKDGSEIYHWADGTMITAVAVDKNGKGLILSSTYARGGTFRSTVTKLSFDPTEVAMQTAPVETLTFRLAYCDGGFWLLGSDRLLRFSDDGTPAYTFTYDYELADYSLSDGIAALVFEGIGGRSGDIAVLTADSDSAYTASADSSVNDIYSSEHEVYICYDSRIDAIAPDGAVIATAPVDTVYREFAVLDGNIYLLGYHSVERIEFSF